MKLKDYIIVLSILTVLTGCFDLFHRTYWSDGQYTVEDDAGNVYKTLYLNFPEGGIGRVKQVSKIGSDKKYIIIESFESNISNEMQYWILNKEEDNKYYNADEIVEGPMDYITFKHRKEKLGIIDLKFEKL